jgi:plastocyanin
MRTETDAYGYVGASTFNPGSVIIARGGTVTWTNSSGNVHNVTFVSAAGVPADVSDLPSGSVGRTFGTAGTFSYSCTNHSGMSGSVNVQ